MLRFPHASSQKGPVRRPLVMGIVNAAPDSFSGDGRPDPEAALAHALALAGEGADMLDLGGCSTRPGAAEVAEEEEAARLLPLVRALRPRTRLPLSVDTFRPAVAKACLEAGADMVNDQTALAGAWGRRPPAARPPDMAVLCARHGAHLALMHAAGSPEGGWRAAEYPGGVVEDVGAFLRERRRLAAEAGVPEDLIWLDPGFGFGKSDADHALLLAGLRGLGFGLRIMAGLSRKGWVGRLSGLPPARRGPASARMAALAARNGAALLRVHDVALTLQALESM